MGLLEEHEEQERKRRETQQAERDRRHKAESDGYYDAWARHEPSPTQLNDSRYEEDYMRGYDNFRDGN
jgi:hypothetical protein